jgi:hypothetical protein
VGCFSVINNITHSVEKVTVLRFAYYNLCRVHKSLRVTPAMQAGITDRIWDIAELLT